MFSSPDVQYGLHEVLIWKAIKPQMQTLHLESQKGIVKALGSHNTRSKLAEVAADSIRKAVPVIEEKVVAELKGQKFFELVKQGLAGFLYS